MMIMRTERSTLLENSENGDGSKLMDFRLTQKTRPSSNRLQKKPRGKTFKLQPRLDLRQTIISKIRRGDVLHFLVNNYHCDDIEFLHVELELQEF